MQYVLLLTKRVKNEGKNPVNPQTTTHGQYHTMIIPTMDVEDDDGRRCYHHGDKYFEEIHVRQNHQQRHRNRQKMKKPSRSSSLVVFALVVVLVSILSSSTVTTAARSGGISAGTDRSKNDENLHQQQQRQKEQLPPDFFVEDESVILITGAAGFLGSELALALHRTYSPKLIILVDRMQDRPQSQEQLSLFEFQRQRAFHVMQTLGSRGIFYRVDFAPMIPEYFDLGEVPVLDHIFREYPDITHVVHLADPYPHSSLQIVPYEKDVPKAGMMEALMEQLLVVKRRRLEASNNKQDATGPSPSRPLPHFVYASSSEVYPYAFNVTNGPLDETHPISTPSSLRGASKLIDEMLAKMYYDTRGLYSVGLRFFSVYGPWGVPGSTLFEMAERAVTGDLRLPTDEGETDPEWMSNVQDYVYIDDAIDAVMAAMQFRPPGDKPHPMVFNVASGEGNTPAQIASIMQEFFPPSSKTNADNISESISSQTTTGREGVKAGNDIPHASRRTVAIGSIERSQMILRYQPRVSLRDGIMNLLAWHYDRAFPYGGQKLDDNVTTQNEEAKRSLISSRGIESCLPYDKQCLRAAPVFPCASECSHETQCTKSYYDEVIPLTQSLTSECETVLYTVDLDADLASIPSAFLQLQSTSKSFLKGNCNLAFVSDESILVKSLQKSSRMSSFVGGGKDKTILRNGPWILVAMSVPVFEDDFAAENDILGLLPKLSPGIFFGSTTKRAIYIEPNILLDSIPKLLHEAQTQPYNKNMDGATAMLIGRGTPKNYFSNDEDDDDDDEFYQKQVLPSTATLVQNSAYRMVRIAVADKLFGDHGFMELLDSRWMVHTLQSDDARLFRCDVYGEVVQWEVSSDRSALEFILGLHDMWSRVIAKSSGMGPWWIGDEVVTVPERHTMRRRLLEEPESMETIKVDVEAIDNEIMDDHKKDRSETADETDSVQVVGSDTEKGVSAGDVSSKETEPEVEGIGNKERDDNPPEKETGNENENENSGEEEQEDEKDEEEEGTEDESANDDEEDDEDDSDDEEEEESTGDIEPGALVLDAGAQQEVAADEEKRGDSDEDNEDSEQEVELEEGTGRDFSSYDTWMGILSSSQIKYFVRIVPSSEVGVVSIDDE